MKTKTFKCVEMKRRAAERIHREIKDLSFEQKVDYWRRRSEVFRAEQDRLRQLHKSANEELDHSVLFAVEPE